MRRYIPISADSQKQVPFQIVLKPFKVPPGDENVWTKKCSIRKRQKAHRSSTSVPGKIRKGQCKEIVQFVTGNSNFCRHRYFGNFTTWLLGESSRLIRLPLVIVTEILQIYFAMDPTDMLCLQ